MSTDRRIRIAGNRSRGVTGLNQTDTDHHEDEELHIIAEMQTGYNRMTHCRTR